MILYDRNGVPAAYIDSNGEHIYLFNGKPTACLNEDVVYGFGGTQYGWFEEGWIRDLDGYCAMSADKVRTQGSVKSSRHEAPTEQARIAKPMRRSRETKRSKTAYKAAWSKIAAGDFLSGSS